MMFRLKKLIFLLMVSMMVFALSLPSYGGTTIKVIVDGKNLVFDVPPFIEEGRTLVPLRGIFEALGAVVSYDQKSNTVKASKGTTIIELPIGKTEAKVGNLTKKLDVPAKIVNSRTMIPVRFISEALGAEVSWDEQNQIVTVTSEQNTELYSPGETPAWLTSSDIVISDVYLKKEIVYVQNRGFSAVDLTGWKLVSAKDNRQFVFPAFTLNPKHSVRIISGTETEKEDEDLLWTTDIIWNNHEAESALLYDQQGKLKSTYPD